MRCALCATGVRTSPAPGPPRNAAPQLPDRPAGPAARARGGQRVSDPVSYQPNLGLLLTIDKSPQRARGGQRATLAGSAPRCLCSMLEVVVPTTLRVLHARYRHCVLLRSGFWAQSLSRVHVPVIDQFSDRVYDPVSYQRAWASY